MKSLSGIARHWSRKSQIGKGIRLEAGDLDILNAIGVGELIARKAAEQQRALSCERLEAAPNVAVQDD